MLPQSLETEKLPVSNMLSKKVFLRFDCWSLNKSAEEQRFKETNCHTLPVLSKKHTYRTNLKAYS